MYVYIKTDLSLWTVGFYDSSGKWTSESDHDSTIQAAERVAWLNGETEYESGVALNAVAAMKTRITELEDFMAILRGKDLIRQDQIAELQSQLAAALATIEAAAFDNAAYKKIISEWQIGLPEEANKRITELEAQLAAEVASRAEGCKP